MPYTRFAQATGDFGRHMIRTLIVLVVSNYFLTFLIIGLLFAAIALARHRGPLTGDIVVEKLLAWHVFWSIGVSYLCNFIFHGFFGELAASFIGWADSPFQLEVATASLGFSAVGFLAAFRSFDLRLAAIVGPGLFTLGAAAVHVREMIDQHNFAPGNAGVVFYMDIAIPLFGLALLYAARRNGGHRSPPLRPR
jgi:hypothetical protein